VSNLLWVTILLPFFGAFILMLLGTSMPKKVMGAIGCATVGIAWVTALIFSIYHLAHNPNGAVTVPLYEWMAVGLLRVQIAIYFDALALVMTLVITFVAFFIHLYSFQSMYDEEDYRRFFAYMNLFVGSMLTLVLSNNLLLLYLGWEGVGLCSYLLIGFWYKDRNNGIAAQKAFIVTRVGDTALAIGLFFLFYYFRTFNIQAILAAAPVLLPFAGTVITAITFLIIGGAIGKSAQIPLQTWLPDAMAGPTPVSALIHAATMVTAGVYLIARLYTLFMMAPDAMLAVGFIGSVTLFYSGFSALVQRDIKRVLAYSTISQIGYMFVALGVGAWTAAIFHFVTHAFFKALLFLAAGVVIDAQHEEHDLFKMGGLKNKLPLTYWTFLIGAASLSALPIMTAGFFSKDAIIWACYSSTFTRTWFWVAALLSAFITAAYTFRALFLAFHGEQKMEVSKYPGSLMKLALVVLAFFSITVGYIGWPELLLNFDPFGHFMSSVFRPISPGPLHYARGAEAALLFVSAFEVFTGLYIAWRYAKARRWAGVVDRSPVARAVHRFFFEGWGFDWAYDWLIVKPFKAITYANYRDFIDSIYLGIAAVAGLISKGIAASQTGRVRNYAAGLILGAVIITAIVLLR